MVLNTREKILEAFFELAMEHPNKMHFSLAEIAKKAGISNNAYLFWKGIISAKFENSRIVFLHKKSNLFLWI